MSTFVRYGTSDRQRWINIDLIAYAEYAADGPATHLAISFKEELNSYAIPVPQLTLTGHDALRVVEAMRSRQCPEHQRGLQVC